MRIAARVAADKVAHPERYCEVDRCLWRTPEARCPRHDRRRQAERRINSELRLDFYNRAFGPWPAPGPDRRQA